MNAKEKYDIIIIGSGLGGLTCGCILSQRGYRVCVLEQHIQIGGCLQDFKRKGKLFDTGMHYIGSYDNGQILNTLFRYFNIYDKIDVKKLDNDGFDIMITGTKKFSVPQGINAFKTKLNKHFPSEENAINLYFKKLQEVFDSIDIVNLREIKDFEFSLKEGLDESVFEFVSSITENKDLQNILCFSNALYAGKKETASLFMHAVINIFYLQSAWKLEKGGGQIAHALKTVIEKNGGNIITKAKVTSLLCSENKVNTVVVNNVELLNAETVISNIDPLTTMELLEGANVRKAFLNRLKRQEQTMSCFSLYIVLKEKSFKYKNSNIYYYNSDNIWSFDKYDIEKWPLGYMMYMHESKENIGYAETMILLSPMDYKEMHKWNNTKVEQRGEDYLKMKEQKSEQLLNLIEKEYPNIRECIDSKYTASPLTYRDYTGVRDGAMYGVYKDCKKPFESQILPKTYVSNLFLTGQNINMHGILGVSMGALLTCGEIEDINSIITDIRKCKK